MDTLRQDLRFAIRMLLRSPGFAALAVTALALGIGANTAIFSIVNAVLLRPLPYESPDRLVTLWETVQRATIERRELSFADFLDWQRDSRSFESMAAFSSSTLTLSGGGEPERVGGESVTHEYFPLLGVNAIRGRIFSPEDDRNGKPPTALISHGLWMRRFGSDPSIISKSIEIDGAKHTVVGVLPDGFRGLSDTAEVFLPFRAATPQTLIGNRGSRWHQAIARLKRGVTVRQAQTELDGIAGRLERAYPATNEKRGAEVARMSDEVAGDLRKPLFVLLAAVALVLLIACGNVANLLLARAEARQKEISVRVALGAGRGRLIRQFVTESLLLAFIGAALGSLLAVWAVDVLQAHSPVTLPSFVKLGIDLRALLFTAGIAAITGILLGLAPAFHTRADLHMSLKESSGRSSGGRLRRRFRGTLVVVEVALSLTLLIGAGLLLRSFRRLLIIDPGFRPDGLVTLRLGFPRLENSDASASRTILERMRAVPGVQAAALTTAIPLADEWSAIFYTAEGQPPVTAQNMPRAYIHRVTPEYFRTLGITTLGGRTFTGGELQSRAPVVIVSENVARRFWPGQDAVGKRIKAGSPGAQNPWWTIIGVAAEVKHRGLPRNPTPDPDIYLPFNENSRGFALVVRARGQDAAAVVPALRGELRRLDSTATVYNVATMRERVRAQMARSRFTSWSMGIFSAAGLLLAVIGIYGVMSYTVSQRTQEIGIRIALGAGNRDVLRTVLGNGLTLVAAGIAVGVLMSLTLARYIAALLYGVRPSDALTYFAVSMLIAGTALIAAWVPARRASKVDPIIALRYE